MSDSEKEEKRKKVDPRNKLNDLNGTEWIKETKSVWFQQGLGRKHEHAQIEKEHPAPFSFQDVQRLIEFFTKKNQKVLDPFSGVASTLKACALTDRVGVGIELSKHWNKLGEKRLKLEVGEKALENQNLITGDNRDVLPTLERESFHFVVTSPPYWNILNKKADQKVKKERLNNDLAKNYSEEDKDIGNIESYSKFLSELTNIFLECQRVLIPGQYMAVIVSDFRHKSKFISFHSDLISRLTENNKFILQGVKVLVQNNKRLYPYGYPYAYVENIHHQYIVIFRKPRGN
jgi:DNA modification methylase